MEEDDEKERTPHSEDKEINWDESDYDSIEGDS